MASLGTTKVAVILALLGSIAVFIVTTLSAFALFRSAAMEEAEVQAGQRGDVVGRVALAPFLTDELVDLDPVLSGIDVEVRVPNQRMSPGLQLLSDLAANVGADLGVLSRPGQGTTVGLELAGKR